MNRTLLILQTLLTAVIFLLTITGAIGQIYLGLANDTIAIIIWAALIIAVGFLFAKSYSELKQELKN